MTAVPGQHTSRGHATFARYAFPPNELGYCGPSDASVLLHGDPAGVALATAAQIAVQLTGHRQLGHVQAATRFTTTARPPQRSDVVERERCVEAELVVPAGQ